jgi:lipid II:glycine glycyltransferase (peptidoglycan interpeptide bridge formation enzyme)
MESGDELQGEFLEEISESLRYFLPKHCILIRYDLPWESQWANEDDFFDRHNNWIGPPAKRNQEFRLNFNTNKWNLVKANSDILPSNTIFIDLKKDKNELLKKMKSKTRYNIRLFQRKGLSVRNVGLQNIEIWYSLYKETAKRNNIFLDGINYFKTMLNTKSNNSLSPAEVELLIAGLNGKPLAAMFLAISGRRGTYLSGASSPVKKEMYGN